mmetsp:Transcript_13646/g.26095  ORF Transcript_13646/g.26095 Transcript_13646/m.26095 type:complete len:83 (+) Transcript_13646:3258-3506(+)
MRRRCRHDQGRWYCRSVVKIEQEKQTNRKEKKKAIPAKLVRMKRKKRKTKPVGEKFMRGIIIYNTRERIDTMNKKRSYYHMA